MIEKQDPNGKPRHPMAKQMFAGKPLIFSLKRRKFKTQLRNPRHMLVSHRQANVGGYSSYLFSQKMKKQDPIGKHSASVGLVALRSHVQPMLAMFVFVSFLCFTEWINNALQKMNICFLCCIEKNGKGRK
jgi:hypothetical protein